MALIFQKQAYFVRKSVIFFLKHFPHVNFNLALNEPWDLEFQHYWGTRARVTKGTKCSDYTHINLPIMFFKTHTIFIMTKQYHIHKQMHVYVNACLTSSHHSTYASMHGHVICMFTAKQKVKTLNKRTKKK